MRILGIRKFCVCGQDVALAAARIFLAFRWLVVVATLFASACVGGGSADSGGFGDDAARDAPSSSLAEIVLSKPRLIGVDRVRLVWAPVDGADSYQVFRGDDLISDNYVARRGGMLLFENSGVPAGSHKYFVQACDDNGECSKAAFEEIDVPPPPPDLRAVAGRRIAIARADARKGAAVLTVSLRIETTIAAFFEVGGFSSGGGRAAVISLAADGLFSDLAADESLALTLTAANRSGSATATVFFASPLPPHLGEIAGRTVTVGRANAVIGEPILTVSPANEGVVAAFSNAGGFSSRGGRAAVISPGADALFFGLRPGEEIALTLTASNRSGSATATVFFTPPGAPVGPLRPDSVCVEGPSSYNGGINPLQQWPCRLEVKEILDAMIARGERTLIENNVYIYEPAGWHRDKVMEIFNRYGTGAPASPFYDLVRVTLSPEDLARSWKPPGKRERWAPNINYAAHSVNIVNHSADSLCRFGFPRRFAENGLLVFKSAGNYRSRSIFEGCYYRGRLGEYLSTGQWVLVGALLDEVGKFWDGFRWFEFGSRILLNGLTQCGHAAEYCIVEDGYGSCHSTSCLAPHAAAAAQILANVWPQLSAGDIAALILEMAEDIGPPGPDPEFGMGRLSFARLFEPGGVVAPGGGYTCRNHLSICPPRYRKYEQLVRYSCDIDAAVCRAESI